MRDEGHDAKEWIDHHRLLGHDRIVIYDNGSTDDSWAVFRVAAALYPEVTVVPWPDRDALSPQRSAYQHALANCATEWIGWIDADEFLNLRGHRTIGDYLASLPTDCGAVGINWLVHGSGGAQRRAPGHLRERFLRASTDRYNMNRHIKTYARAAWVEEVKVHHVRLKRGRYLDAMGDPIAEPGPHQPVRHEGPVLHHYVVKSREEFEAKRRRPNAAARVNKPGRERANLDDDFFRRADRNDVRCEEMVPYVARARTPRARLADWLIAALLRLRRPRPRAR